jgi:putative membrane-bound dehydrogenase-like protein
MCSIENRSMTTLEPTTGDPRKAIRLFSRIQYVVMLIVALVGASAPVFAQSKILAGAASVDVTPTILPVIQNGGFIEARADRVEDPLHARCIVLDDGSTRIALVVVDSCMIPRELCDTVKKGASQQTGIAKDRIMISATHTHSAPSVMDHCLGSRADPVYPPLLAERITHSITQANSRLAPARLGWTRIDASGFTACRRWITRPDRMLEDPFGNRSVRAMMHPGYQNPDYVGPSGPVDPWLSLLSIQTADGQPLAVLANFSMHYFGGHRGVSSDYYGRFAARLQNRFAPHNPRFVGIMSQGTSGDLWRTDYGQPETQTTIDEFTDGLVGKAIEALMGLEHTDTVSMDMAEKRIVLRRRVPDESRLAWARNLVAKMDGRRPENRPEVYAEQAIYLHEHPDEEVVLQAIRIGELGITAIPNEVFAITGLKLKARSPLDLTFNVSLANGASGYIPPPEQHQLGGYTTWPARTAGLEVSAEPKIVETMLALLEKVAGKSRRDTLEPIGTYGKSVLGSKPIAYWRCAELDGVRAVDVTGHANHGRYSPAMIYHLDGVPSHAFANGQNNRAVYLAGGQIRADLPGLGDSYSVQLWFWNGLPFDAREVTGTILSTEFGDLSIGGTSRSPGCLIIGDRAAATPLEPKTWYQLVVVNDRSRLHVYLNGQPVTELSTEANEKGPRKLIIGGDGDAGSRLEGKVDEVSIFDRALAASEIASHYAAANLSTDSASNALRPDFQPMSAEETLRRTHVTEGLTIELVAAEPLVLDPVAIDWGPDGKLWVAEMADYPYGMDGQGKAGGRIRYLTDSDGDGRYDKSTLFLDEVNFPTSVMAWGNGVLVTAAPHLFYAEDTGGTGRADVRQVLYEGFVEGNQQLRVNCLRWGLDNWVYCASGGHHPGFGADTRIRSARTGNQIHLGSHDFRFQPDRDILDPQSGPAQFGRVRDDWGSWFGVQNSHPLWHYVVGDHYLRRNTAIPYADMRKQLRLPINPQVFPVSTVQKRYHSFDNAGRYTSACGPEIYRDELLFDRQPHIQHAFTCEPFHNVVQHHIIVDDGSSFTGRRADDGKFDFFASEDGWCRPVMARTGPDGALWIVDMYRYMIEHPDWLPEDGRNDLKPFYRSGDDRGRIYRVYRTGRPPREIIRISDQPIERLVELLGTPNGTVRDLAHRALLQDSNSRTVPLLEQVVASSQSELARLHAIAVLDGRHKLPDELLIRALEDSHPAVRRNALRIAEARGKLSPKVAAAASQLADDDDPKVRLQLACSLGEWSDQTASSALARLIERPDNDFYMQAALLSSVGPHLERLAERVSWDKPEIDLELIDGVLRSAQSNPRILAALLARLVPGTTLTQPTARRLADWLDSLGEQNQSLATLRSAGDAALWRELDRIEACLASAGQLAADPGRPVAERALVARLLGRIDSTRPFDLQLLVQLVSPRHPDSLQIAAIRRLVAISGSDRAGDLLEIWASLSPTVREVAIDEFLSSKAWTTLLLDRIEQGLISPAELTTLHRQRLLSHPDKKVADSAARLMSNLVQPDRRQLIERYSSSLAGEGRKQHGFEQFKKHCAKCHVLDASSPPIGPDLRSITDRSKLGLMQSILDPSRDVEPKYLSYSVTLNDGRLVTGMIVGESGESIVVQLADGTQRSLVRSSIESMRSSGLSFMPTGFESEMTPQDVADVIEFIRDDLRKSE